MISEKKVWWYDGLWLARQCPVGQLIWIQQSRQYLFWSRPCLHVSLTGDDTSVWCCNQGPPFSHPGATLKLLYPALPEYTEAGSLVLVSLFWKLKWEQVLTASRGSWFHPFQRWHSCLFCGLTQMSPSLTTFSIHEGFPSIVLSELLTQVWEKLIMSANYARPRCARSVGPLRANRRL